MVLTEEMFTYKRRKTVVGSHPRETSNRPHPKNPKLVNLCSDGGTSKKKCTFQASDDPQLEELAQTVQKLHEKIDRVDIELSEMKQLLEKSLEVTSRFVSLESPGVNSMKHELELGTVELKKKLQQEPREELQQKQLLKKQKQKEVMVVDEPENEEVFEVPQSWQTLKTPVIEVLKEQKQLETDDDNEFETHMPGFWKILTCSTCIGIIWQSRAAIDCLQHFCKEFVNNSMRQSNHGSECGLHLASACSLREDDRWNQLIGALYPDMRNGMCGDVELKQEERTHSEQTHQPQHDYQQQLPQQEFQPQQRRQQLQRQKQKEVIVISDVDQDDPKMSPPRGSSKKAREDAAAKQNEMENVYVDGSITIDLPGLQKLLTCPICLGTVRQARAVADCLHRFCKECIEKSLRLGKHECPSCRTHLASTRSLREDKRWNQLVEALYPLIKNGIYEDVELNEVERACNEKIQASFAQISQKQSGALPKRLTIPRTNASRSKRSHESGNGGRRS